MQSNIRMALAQINPTVGDLTGNCNKIVAYIKKARSIKADIVVFPELALTGYPPEDLLLKGHFVQESISALSSIRRETNNITAVIGTLERSRTKQLYNAAVIVRNRKRVNAYYKIMLPNYGVFDEKRYFTAGTANTVYRHGSVLFGLSICEDIWEQHGPCNVQAHCGAQMLINISASPYHKGKRSERERMLRGRARQLGTSICYCNIVGGQDELVFDGGSFIIDARGKMIAAGKQFEEDLVVADIAMPVFRRLKPRKSIIVVSKSDTMNPLPMRGRVKGKLTSIEEIYKALLLGTRDYVLKNGFKKVVIGLSGGIDSALTAAIAVDALGKDQVVGVSMPSRYSSSGTQRDALLVAKRLGIAAKCISIKKIYDAFIHTLKGEFKGTRMGIAEENIQARVRGTILMALSNKFGWLVLTTGNKSETAVGYCTLYGDMAGGFAVIKDLSKTSVYELAKYINKLHGRDVIPQSVLKRAPSAELRPGQKDQDSLPPYAVLDPILRSYIEEDKSFLTLLKENYKRKTVKEVLRLVDRSEYKRRQAPPGIKITPKAFGRDRRLPITNRYYIGMKRNKNK